MTRKLTPHQEKIVAFLATKMPQDWHRANLAPLRRPSIMVLRDAGLAEFKINKYRCPHDSFCRLTEAGWLYAANVLGVSDCKRLWTVYSKRSAHVAAQWKAGEHFDHYTPEQVAKEVTYRLGEQARAVALVEKLAA